MLMAPSNSPDMLTPEQPIPDSAHSSQSNWEADKSADKPTRWHARLLAKVAWLPRPLDESVADPGGAERALWAYLLLPGFSIGFHAAVFGRSRSAVRGYLLEAEAAAARDPSLRRLAKLAISNIRPEDGLRMAAQRGGAHLPYWSRLAIREFRKAGLSRIEIARTFRCSLGSVTNVLRGKQGGFHPLAGTRLLSSTQHSPPNRFSA